MLRLGETGQSWRRISFTQTNREWSKWHGQSSQHLGCGLSPGVVTGLGALHPLTPGHGGLRSTLTLHASITWQRMWSLFRLETKHSLSTVSLTLCVQLETEVWRWERVLRSSQSPGVWPVSWCRLSCNQRTTMLMWGTNERAPASGVVSSSS